MGKAEEQALLKAIPLIDPTLTTILERARSFCCSEQAVRSTKSRLNKKMDISVFRPE